MASSLIESELLRKVKYDELVEWLQKATHIEKKGTVQAMLLRYRFNQEQLDGDDPVFIASPSPNAVSQLRKDMLNFNVDPAQRDTIEEQLASMIATACKEMKETVLPLDKKLTLLDGMLTYGKRSFKDLRALGEINAPHAFALQLRYEYMHLENHGLARIYSGNRNDETEAFASSFNHYYDNYCSVFPDLERAFGSRGSFFSMVEFDTDVVQVNPPFDETVMEMAMERVYMLLANGATNTFVFTIPKWEDYEPLLKLENSKWTTTILDYEKGELEFIDHMTGKVFSPCGIVEVTLRNEL